MIMSFKRLGDAEEKEFKRWARNNYRPFSEINGTWHPVTQQECVNINIENSEFVDVDRK